MMCLSAILRVFTGRRKQQFKTATSGKHCVDSHVRLRLNRRAGVAARHVRTELDRLVATAPEHEIRKVRAVVFTRGLHYTMGISQKFDKEMDSFHALFTRYLAESAEKKELYVF